jgi:hypothetical protein
VLNLSEIDGREDEKSETKILISKKDIRRRENFICLSTRIYGSRAIVDIGRFFSFLMHTRSVGLPGQGISLSIDRYLHRINAHTSMPRVGFERTIPVFERVKTAHALDRHNRFTFLNL